MVVDFRIKMVDFEVGFAIPLFKRKGAKLALPSMQFKEENADSRRGGFVSLGCARKYFRSRLSRRFLCDTQQFFLCHLARPLLCQPRKGEEFFGGVCIRACGFEILASLLFLSFLN